MLVNMADSIELGRFENLIRDTFKIQHLRPNQERGIRAIGAGKDLFLGTKTGSGKSLVYETIPVLHKGCCVVVIVPLVSIMIEQCKRLCLLGFKATYIGKDVSESEDIAKCKFDFLFGSPEQLVGETKWREALKTSYQERLKALVVDEAHTVIQWGESGDQQEDPFRAWFSRIGELRSLCPNAQLVALTATSGPSSRRKIMDKLCFRNEREIIVESPDRENIKIHCKLISNIDIPDEVFAWLIDCLKTHKEKMPRHVIFCETIADVSKIYVAFLKHFDCESKLVNMYHSKTNECVKEKIRNDMAKDGDIRVLICTNSAGMGVNFFCVHNIIHYGIPRDMDTFVQQMGRCGRDGLQSNEIVLFKKHKSHLKKVEPDLVKFVMDETECRRYSLCTAYLMQKTAITPLHNCCDICEKKCKCGASVCPLTHEVFTYHSDSEEEAMDAMRREVSEEEKLLVCQRLNAIKLKMSTSKSLVQAELIHGLTEEAISDIVDKCAQIFTPDDVMKLCSIWSYETAVTVCNSISDIFGDTEMYMYLSETDSD